MSLCTNNWELYLQSSSPYIYHSLGIAVAYKTDSGIQEYTGIAVILKWKGLNYLFIKLKASDYSTNKAPLVLNAARLYTSEISQCRF